MKLYDVTLENGTVVTVLARSISKALNIAEIDGFTAIECKFVRNIDNLAIEDFIVENLKYRRG